jgi:hypothetical protein
VFLLIHTISKLFISEDLTSADLLLLTPNLSDLSQPHCGIFNKLCRTLFELKFLWYIIHIEKYILINFQANRMTLSGSNKFYKGLTCFHFNLKIDGFAEFVPSFYLLN